MLDIIWCNRLACNGKLSRSTSPSEFSRKQRCSVCFIMVNHSVVWHIVTRYMFNLTVPFLFIYIFKCICILAVLGLVFFSLRTYDPPNLSYSTQQNLDSKGPIFQ